MRTCAIAMLLAAAGTSALAAGTTVASSRLSGLVLDTREGVKEYADKGDIQPVQFVGDSEAITVRWKSDSSTSVLERQGADAVLWEPLRFGEYEFLDGQGNVATLRYATVSRAQDGRTCDLDTREIAVRKVDTAADFLPLAWNGDSAWSKGGAAGGVAKVMLQPMALPEGTGDASDPKTWAVAEGFRERTVVNRAGEGTKVPKSMKPLLCRLRIAYADATEESAWFDFTDVTDFPAPEGMALILAAID